MTLIQKITALITRQAIALPEGTIDGALVEPELEQGRPDDRVEGMSASRPLQTSEITNPESIVENHFEAITALGACTLVKSSPTSIKKAEANRRNAKLSTGPRTARGKQIASRNAFKHGVFAEDMVVTKGDGKEVIAEFRALVAQLILELRPVGILEMLEVEKIAQCIWRKKRIARFEAGQIQLKTANVEFESLLQDYSSMEKFVQNPYIYRQEMVSSPAANRTLIEVLKSALAELRSDPAAVLSVARAGALIRAYGDCPALASYQEAVTALRKRFDEKEMSSEEMENLPETKAFFTAREALAVFIEDEITRRVKMLRTLYERHELHIDAEIKSECLPDQPTYILKLERKLEKDLQLAVETLKRLQQSRMSGAN